MRIPLSQPQIGEREIAYVTRALRSGQLSLGPILEEFERRFASYIGTRYAIATNSGTSALHVCVKAMGIGPEDDVLTTSFSFVASTNCLLYEGAAPVFADIDPLTLNLSPIEIRKVIARDYVWDNRKRRLVNRLSGRLLKAILPVHVFGSPCDMAEIPGIAREYDLMVLEDACEAIGAEYAGRRVGSFGEAAAFAFYPNKQMTTAEGGMVVTNHRRIAMLCRSLRNQGRDEEAGWLRHVRLGFNYRLSELHCALGLAQLERIDELLSARARVAAWYSRALAGIPEIALPRDLSGATRAWFAYAIRLRGPYGAVVRDRLLDGLRERGIGCQTYFQPIHRQPYFRQKGVSRYRALPITDSAAERCLALPFFSSMTLEQVTEVCSTVRQIIEESQLSIESNEARPGAVAQTLH
jgi:perosamine synthetase